MLAESVLRRFSMGDYSETVDDFIRTEVQNQPAGSAWLTGPCDKLISNVVPANYSRTLETSCRLFPASPVMSMLGIPSKLCLTAVEDP